MHLFTLFSITRHCFSLFLVGSKSMLAILPFKATITPRHWNDKCFHRAWGLDLPIWYLRITFPMYSWCATRNPVPDSTYHLVDLTSVTTESRNVSPCMTATPWSRVNWKMCDENSTFGCFDAICTQSVSHDHTCGTVHDFLAVLTDRACRHSQQDGSDSTCGRRVHAVQNKTPEQTSACFACIIWHSIKSRAINCFNKCVFGFNSHWKVWYKSEKAFGMCSEWHYTTRGLAYGDMTTRPTGSLSCLHPPISLVV